MDNAGNSFREPDASNAASALAREWFVEHPIRPVGRKRQAERATPLETEGRLAAQELE